jgi:hypothetical protein
VPLVDVSGSMEGQPMEAAIALGLLVSELAHPAFRHRALTFESRPQWVSLPEGGTILERVRAMQAADWGGSTDFEAACERILDAAQRAKLKPDEVPDLIVFSDMQFDQARSSGYYGGGGRAASWETHFDRLSRRFAEVGVAVCGEAYAPPRIVFWNLRGDTGAIRSTRTRRTRSCSRASRRRSSSRCSPAPTWSVTRRRWCRPTAR